MSDFEDWEAHHDFHERRDYKGLVSYCENEIKCHPDDLHAAERLADAYILSADYEKAIEFAGPLHHAHPDISSFQHRILDALFAVGKSEKDFEWSLPPTIVRLDRAFANKFHDFLRPKRKPRPIYSICWELEMDAYFAFSNEELLEYLRRDPRFVIAGDNPVTASISISRPTRSKTKK